MHRYVYHELAAGVTWLAGALIGWTAAVVVRGSVPVGGDTVLKVIAYTAGCLAVLTLLHVSGIRWVSGIRDLRGAVPLPSDARLPRPAPFHVLLSPPYVLLFLAPVLLTYFWPDDSLIAFLLPMDWLARAAAAVWFERRTGRRVWRGYHHQEPWRLTYSPTTK
ncbi:hypothetical protein ABZ848_13200 [Streptomyces sp. NPDC047081]|uniref:hypothetical protein n=1 Tax=Streptomyces sp. NPDC047081 TaxID=3154706 RepID=UPI0033C9F24C